MAKVMLDKQTAQERVAVKAAVRALQAKCPPVDVVCLDKAVDDGIASREPARERLQPLLDAQKLVSNALAAAKSCRDVGDPRCEDRQLQLAQTAYDRLARDIKLLPPLQIAPPAASSAPPAPSAAPAASR